ncbi:DNA adenine methylase (plasmid) [Metaplanococcus flavidus]
MPATKSPLRYPGGKTQLAKYINDIIDTNFNHTPMYIEPFAGGAGIALSLLLKNKAQKIVINDYDPAIYLMWHSLLYFTDDFNYKITNSKLDIDEWYRQQEIQQNPSRHTEFEIGFSTFYLNRTNRSGIIKAGPIGGKNQTGKYKLDCRFNKENLMKKVNIISSEKDRIKLHNLDALELIEIYFSKKEAAEDYFTFFDPPYFKKGPGLYTNFYDYEDHLNLSSIIKSYSNHKWIVTYDDCVEIQDMYSSLKNYNYSLNYSLSTKKKTSELIIFSDKVEIPSSKNIVFL